MGSLLLAAGSLIAGAAKCSPKVVLPENPPLHASDYNGIALQDICSDEAGPRHVYLVGDWGGIVFGDLMPPVPADKRSKLFAAFRRDFVFGVDDRAQILVADQMRILSQTKPPDFVLNVGDNFYWGGVDAKCGSVPFKNFTNQWRNIFENVYYGAGLEGKPWFGVLGNHDYGGFHFTAAWDQTIGYSWGGSEHSTGRWITAAQYYSQKVIYPEFSIDMFFLDTNVMEAWEPQVNPSHNLCGAEHNGKNATCGPQGPHSVNSCVDWFNRLYEEQLNWLEGLLAASEATFQVIVSHFGPKWGVADWSCLVDRYGIDLFVSGHLHYQSIQGPEHKANPVKGTTVVISGGGGGITSEYMPSQYGKDDQYGFVHLTFDKDQINVQGISHGGDNRTHVVQKPRGPRHGGKCIPPPRPTHFWPVDGGADRSCRGESSDNDNFLLLQNMPTQESCMRHCQRTPQCTGIEFGNKVCQVWMAEIKSTVEVKGYTCMKLFSGPGGDVQITSQPSIANETLLKAFGKDRECRGQSEHDRSHSDFHATRTPTLEGCERICLTTKCMGIEYGPGDTCNIWRTEVKHSVHRQGVACVPYYHIHAGAAELTEIAGLLHV